ncbi:hypothetical protein ACJZ2D_010825 [Fusarium nematophilum]
MLSHDWFRFLGHRSEGRPARSAARDPGRRRAGLHVNTAAFSVAVRGWEARLYVTWKHNDQEYYTAQFAGLLLYDPENYHRFCTSVGNILDWGANERFQDIQRSLDRLVEKKGSEKASRVTESSSPPSLPSGSLPSSSVSSAGIRTKRLLPGVVGNLDKVHWPTCRIGGGPTTRSTGTADPWWPGCRQNNIPKLKRGKDKGPPRVGQACTASCVMNAPRPTCLLLAHRQNKKRLPVTCACLLERSSDPCEPQRHTDIYTVLFASRSFCSADCVTVFSPPIPLAFLPLNNILGHPDDNSNSRAKMSSDTGGQSGSDADVDDFRQDLRQLINRIEAAGSFATGGVLDAFPIPGICVDGEPIALPLSKEAARNLASQSDKAPFGKNGETLVDETVRKTLEISAERISFRNPSWHDFVNDLAKRVVHELGVPSAPDGSNVRAELYKNLLYEPGAMFKAQKDTEKAPGMFGTLVICLPSEHTGGTIKTVQTGYRWVLTYNLINDSKSSCPSASVLDSQIERLVNALSSWENLQSPPDFLTYPLDHQYTPRNLRLSSLKGKDYQHARYLADSCARHGRFYLFLAQLEMYDSWPNCEEGENEWNHTRGMYLHHVCNLEGFEVSPLQGNIAETSLLCPISYDQRDPDTRAGGDYLGNQHADIEETYSDTVVLIVPENFLHAPLFGTKVTTQYPGQVDAVMKHLMRSIGDGNNNPSLRKILVCLCLIILDEGFAAEEENDVYLGHVAVTAAFLGDRRLFQEAQKKTCKFWQDDSWFALGGLVGLQQVPSVGENDIDTALLKCPTFRGVYQGLTHFYREVCRRNTGRQDQARTEYWKQWYSDRLIKTLGLCIHCRGGEDAATIMKIVLDHQIQYTPEQRKTMDEAVTNVIDKFKEDKKFVKVLTVELLLELSRPDNVRLTFLRRLLGIFLGAAISTFDLCCAYRLEANRGRDGRLVREFYNQALAHSEDAASRLLREISNQASSAKKDTAQQILLPLMKELLPSVDTSSPEVQDFFQLLVKAYITKGVGEEPLKPEDWASPSGKLKAFLEDPGAKEKTVTLSTDEEGHLKWKFEFLTTEKVGGEGGQVRFTKTLKGWERCHRDWEQEAEKAKQNLQSLPKDELERALGDQYDTLMALDLIRADRGTAEQGGGGQAPDEAESPARPKRRRDKGLDDTGHQTTPKRARRSGEEIES